MDENSLKFEQGPIRPPNEAQSLLLRFTRNCPWNHCLFCPVYKGRKFSLRTVEEIKDDIDTAREIVDDIEALSKKLGGDGRVDGKVMTHILHRSQYSTSYRSVAVWMHYGTDACFLQDADNLIMKTDHLVEVLTYLKQRLPRISRVTTYTRSRTVSKKSVESLHRIRKAGLDRIHIGLETGYDPLLKLVKKGVTADGHIDAGHRVLGAGMELSEYVMPGLGGQEMWKEHAEETARVLNEINPNFIRLRSLRVPKRVPLYEKLEAGTFTMQTDDMLAEELRVFISSLDGITSTITSDHMMNLLEEVSGNLPRDKEKMLAVIEDYQALSDIDRLVYRTGRRGGTYRSLRDLKRDPTTYRKIRNLIEQVQTEKGMDGVENFIAEMVDRYI
ncbi:MAG: radical SAM protein [Deltaproteobacteria bacterium]|nr:MAG: radical SAM protein [Deltaproteobacteria bacterium]RUA03632.1 MAG: radical SAM protein [Deltaproteobacteria bacterium]